jgi:hypothetical protein
MPVESTLAVFHLRAAAQKQQQQQQQQRRVSDVSALQCDVATTQSVLAKHGAAVNASFRICQVICNDQVAQTHPALRMACRCSSRLSQLHCKPCPCPSQPYGSAHSPQAMGSVVQTGVVSVLCQNLTLGTPADHNSHNSSRGRHHRRL